MLKKTASLCIWPYLQVHLTACVHTCAVLNAFYTVVNVKCLSSRKDLLNISRDSCPHVCLWMFCIHRCICVYVMKFMLPVFQILKRSWFGRLQIFCCCCFSFFFSFLSKHSSQIKTLQISWRTKTIGRTSCSFVQLPS